MIKGIFLHGISKIAFVLGSYAMHFFLGRYLSEGAYGIVGTIITIMNFEYIFFTDGIMLSMSRAISYGKYREDRLIRTGALFQIFIVGFFFVLTYFGAGTIAGALKDPGLTPYIKNLAFLLPFTGLQSLMLGILNGHKAFGMEAGIQTLYPLLKLSVIPCVLFIFSDPVEGVFGGFLIAGITIALLALACVVRLKKKEGETARGSIIMAPGDYITGAAGYLLLFSSSTFMMNLDTLILKRVTAADDLVGYYTGVVNFAKIPYYLLSACYAVALPVITSSYHGGHKREAAEKISDILTLILSFICPVIIVVAAASRPLLSIFYKPTYSVGAPALILLLFGVGFIGMMLFFSTVLSGADKKWGFILISLLALVVQALLCFYMTKAVPLTGTALSTFIAAGLGMLLSGLLTKRTFGPYIKKIHLLLAGGQLVLFGIYLWLMDRVLNIRSFLVLVAVCGLMFALALVPGVVLKLRDRQKNSNCSEQGSEQLPKI